MAKSLKTAVRQITILFGAIWRALAQQGSVRHCAKYPPKGGIFGAHLAQHRNLARHLAHT